MKLQRNINQKNFAPMGAMPAKADIKGRSFVATKVTTIFQDLTWPLSLPSLSPAIARAREARLSLLVG